MKKRKPSFPSTGDLEFYLKLERPDTQTDDIGGSPRQSWTEITSLWTDLVPRSSRERIVGAQLSEETSHLIESHYWEDWKKGDRFSYTDENTSKTHYYRIVSQLNVNQGSGRIFWEVEEYSGSPAE